MASCLKIRNFILNRVKIIFLALSCAIGAVVCFCFLFYSVAPEGSYLRSSLLGFRLNEIERISTIQDEVSASNPLVVRLDETYMERLSYNNFIQVAMPRTGAALQFQILCLGAYLRLKRTSQEHSLR